MTLEINTNKQKHIYDEVRTTIPPQTVSACQAKRKKFNGAIVILHNDVDSMKLTEIIIHIQMYM